MVEMIDMVRLNSCATGLSPLQYGFEIELLVSSVNQQNCLYFRFS